MYRECEVKVNVSNYSVIGDLCVKVYAPKFCWLASRWILSHRPCDFLGASGIFCSEICIFVSWFVKNK